MIDTIEKTKNCAEFQEILKPILAKLAVQANCKGSERRAALARNTIDVVENLFQYTVSREKAARDLKVEAGKLRAQVQALQGILRPKSHVIVAHAEKPEVVLPEDKEGDADGHA